MWFCYVIILLLASTFSAAKTTVCENRFITKDDVIYILSEQPATAQVAEETCQSYGGRLAQISNQEERQFLEPHLRNLYIPDSLTNIAIFVDSRELYIFISPGGTRTSNEGYRKPGSGQLNRIMLYNSNSVQGFNQPLVFCRFDYRDEHRDLIHFTNGCASGWFYNFPRYGGNPQTDKTILVDHKAFSSFIGIRSILSLNVTGKRIIYIADISVFIGARSHNGQLHWTWNNGTMVADTSNFPPSNTSVCEQMTWPLSYDDGINLRAKDCSDEAYYICQVKNPANAIAQAIECEETMLQLFFSTGGTFPNGTIQLTGQAATILNIPINSNITIRNLVQRTNYSFQLTPYGNGCVVGPTVTVTGRTGYGVPDPVSSAAVVYKTSNLCLLSWKKVLHPGIHISYKITSVSHVANLSTMVLASTISAEAQGLEDSITHSIDLFGHGYGNTVSFQIQALSPCGKLSESVPVTGTCISPMKPTSTNLSPAAIIGIVMGIVAIFILGLLTFIFMNKRNKSNQDNNEEMSKPDDADQGANPATIYEKPVNAESSMENDYVQPNEIQNYENIKQNHAYETMKPVPQENND